MNRYVLIAPLFSTLFLGACERPTVINVPVPVAVPGPAGPTGATGSQGSQGSQGADGSKGDTGKPGEGTTLILIPPAASAPAN
jgi:hypothetical protein